MIKLDSIESAIADITQGKMVIMVDDENRENEGDLVMAAQHVTPESINFMSMYGRGLICLSLLEEDFQRLHIPMMVKNNTAPRQTAFGVSIEAKEGVTTGISAFDRAHTIQTAISENSSAADIVMPGHVFPLCAKAGGVFARDGHTEGGVDIARLAGLKPAAVICEIMADDGTMARLPDLVLFARKHQLKLVSIHDLKTYRARNQKLVELAAETSVYCNEYGEFTVRSFISSIDQSDYVVMSCPPKDPTKPPLVRVHSACFTGDVLGSKRCDCGEQLKLSMQMVADEGGYILYLPQEGRGIGLANKLKAYQLQDKGLDTVEANNKLGFDADLRDYGVAAQILRELGIDKLCLLTNNPRKVDGLQRYGVDVCERIPIETVPHDANIQYLKTKREKLGHWINSDMIKETGDVK